MSPEPFRLAEGGLIDRSRHLRFRFDGQEYGGYQGDTLASALLANGVRLLGRSFKYHRPRGIVTAGSEEPNALVELRNGARLEPNTRATMIELYEGLEAASQNRWPSLRFDLLSANQLFAPIFVAGFYYKTFMWPASFWEPVYERMIRRAAGLGRATREPDPDHYEKCYAHCDLLVVGAGPAGLMAALAAARSGARVILADEGPLPGGRLNSESQEVGGKPGAEWARDLAAEIESNPDARLFRRTAVFGYYDHNSLAAIEQVEDHRAEPEGHRPRQRLWRIQAKRVILACGALERPIVFPDNDRPGVIMASAARSYVNRYAVAPGRQVLLFTNNDQAYRTLTDLRAAGIDLAGVVDPRFEVPESCRAVAAAAEARLFAGSVVRRALGRLGVRGAQIKARSGSGSETLDCDTICVAGGWDPVVHLHSQTGAKPVWDSERACFLPGEPRQAEVSVGAAAGQFTLAACLADGAKAGRAAAEALGFSAAALDIPATGAESGQGIAPFWRVAAKQGKAFVDPQNDVTDKDITLAAREGYVSVEHLKRYTTLGMATDQGKLSNVNGLAILAEHLGREIPEVGITTFRPPYVPVSFGAFTGHSRSKAFQPVRRTPMHDWAEEQGAVFVEAGLWLRAQYFPRPGETHWLQTVDREVFTVRDGVGVCDVSTLGKIDIQGPDAAEFLNRLYINGWKSLPVGKARYGLMLREDGIVMDDGTTSRLAEDHFFMTTTTANAAKVLAHMEFYHQAVWPELDVQYCSVTEQWASMAVAGPKSRSVLQRVIDGSDLSDDKVPYLAAQSVTVQGVPARLFRISFSGELAYELAVPADYGDAVIRLIMEAGKDDGIIPYGTEALGVMRIEKGHVAGPELNGQTTAGDLGFQRMMSTKKDFIGRMLSGRPGLNDPDRPQFVGFRPLEDDARLRAGAHLLAPGTEAVAANDLGYVTSVAHSPIFGQWIGLGMLVGGRERMGDTLRAYSPVQDSDVLVEVVDPIMYDPKGMRLHG